MGKYSRRIKDKRAEGIAIVAGIIVALIGVYFIFGISAETNKKLAKCTEVTTGTVTTIKQDGNKFITTIEYVAEDVNTSIDVTAKKDLGVGSKVDVRYEPLTIKHIYIDGVTPTGASDMLTGLIMIVAGAAMTAIGIWLKSLSKKKKKDVENE